MTELNSNVFACISGLRFIWSSGCIPYIPENGLLGFIFTWFNSKLYNLVLANCFSSIVIFLAFGLVDDLKDNSPAGCIIPERF